MTAAALELIDLTSGYGSSTVVDGVSLLIAPGEIFALVGKNGMGKSSLLKTILSFLPAWNGAVHLEGRDVTRLAPFRKRALGLAYAPQEQALFQDLSVRDNLRLGLSDDRGFEASLSDISGWFPVLTARLSQRAALDRSAAVEWRARGVPPETSPDLAEVLDRAIRKLPEAYRAAVTKGYRFYSYGDAMWIE